MELMKKLQQVNNDFNQKISQADNLKRLDQLFLELFGKSGLITLLPKEFFQLSKQELRSIEPLFKQLKNELEQSIKNRRQEVREESYKKLVMEEIDWKTPVDRKEKKGHLHPITQFENQIADIFADLGFQQYDAPHIDTDFDNFEVLNIPPDHPARDLWDTLYVDQKATGPRPDKLLLRTHTSNAQVRAMKEHKLPIRIMNIGRCFRYENLDARHEHTFDQFELVYIDKGVSMANLQYLSEHFLKAIFGSEIKARLRPKYYPFVEPGAGVDGLCIFCKGQGCKICGGIGWLELAGAGMIHPQVLENGGIDPNQYSGLAWGVGPFRMAMLKYGIEDIRLFNSGDLRFLDKF